MEHYYNVIVKYLLAENSGKDDKVKFKTQREQYLVKADTISNAQKRIKGFITGIYDDFEIVSIKESRILAVVQGIEDGVK